MKARKEWNSFTGPNEIIPSPIRTEANAALPKNLRDNTLKQNSIKAFTDATWTGMNQATVTLAGNDKGTAPMGQAFEKSKRLLEKKKKTKRQRSPSPHPDDEEEEEKADNVVDKFAFEPKNERVATVKAITQVPETLQVENLEQHRHRGNDAALFATKTSPSGTVTRPVTNIIVVQPSPEDIIGYSLEYENGHSWYSGMQNVISDSRDYDLPDIPMMSRKKLVTFLREPNPRKPWERPCINLDCPPTGLDGKFTCIGHYLSEKRLGPGKGYRLREMIFEEEDVYIRNANANNGDGKGFLSSIQEMCYLCHLYVSWVDSMKQRDKYRKRKLGAAPPPPEAGGGGGVEPTQVVIINKFFVMIDTLGEYNGKKMIAGDKVKTGIWGPFPLFQEDNYICSDSIVDEHDGRRLRGFLESDKLLFRLPRVSSPQTESLQKTLSTPCTPTTSASRTTHRSH